jgi:heme/copper-type cytochrome/quinol oxidase subunit 4
MTRSRRATVAAAALVALTVASLLVSEGSLGPWPVAVLAVLKCALILGVFLDLDRSWPGWAALATLIVVSIAAGSAGLVGC